MAGHLAIGQRAGDRLERGGLAGAVGADQRHQFAFADFQRYALDRLDAAVSNAQLFDVQ